MKDAGKEITYRQLTMWDYPWMRTAEQEAEMEVYQPGRTPENNGTGADKRMLERIVARGNLELAVRKVVRNGGSAGIDQMTVQELKAYFEENGEQLAETILKGKYRPKPVKRVEIPKEEKGKMRSLGIPTTVDRVIQQAIAQVLMPIYDPTFSEHSYGFRPGRKAQDAVIKCTEYMNSGYEYVVDMDLEKFFDTVNQSKMAEILSRTIKDGRVISLIHRYMQAGVVVQEHYEETLTGVSQGGPLSPLLSNIMLNELDKELEKRGHRFVRYADDCMILCRSRKAAERTKESITRYIEGKLFLKVNREKTVVAECTEVKYLGFGFYRRKMDGEIRIKVHPKSERKMRDRIRELTRRNQSRSHEERSKEANAYIRGWVNYYGIADMKTLARVTDGWMRRKIRTIIWKEWKRPKTRIRELEKRGIGRKTARQYGTSPKGYWRMAKTPAIHRALGDKVIRGLGYITFTEQFEKVCDTGGTAVCGPACTVV